MKYEVPIIYRGQSNYIVEAASKEEAEKAARTLFENGEVPSTLGNEWETIDRVGKIEALNNQTKGN